MIKSRKSRKLFVLVTVIGVILSVLGTFGSGIALNVGSDNAITYVSIGGAGIVILVLQIMYLLTLNMAAEEMLDVEQQINEDLRGQQ